ncbi:hypothetical protein QBC47DRAFT_290561 [Echria macrotheca]|uniref:Glycosyl transferase n=1 Tax=Echria macrotheca TaxID=438768 RepID=A0AAJ0FGM7_9PEZI|nr:hypothetical protein QBC47DRAFT_290561 [Echria macrotheca]
MEWLGSPNPRKASFRTILVATVTLSVTFTLICQRLFFGTTTPLAPLPSPGDENFAKPLPPLSCPPQREAIPNIVHYVYILKENVTDFHFEFKHFLSVYASHLHLQPDTIYLHTNAPTDALERARAGQFGKWNRLLFNHFPQLQINHVSPPAAAANGKEITTIEHKSDFVRPQIVHTFGGLYLDFDAHPLRDIRVLRESGFNNIFGRQAHGEVNNGVFMARKETLLMEIWDREMNRVYNGDWSSHGNGVLTRIAPRLMSIPGEVLVMEQDALQPGSWEVGDNINLFGLHDDVASNLEGISDGDALPEIREELTDRWVHPERFPRWERDYAGTYILHAFDPGRNANPVEGFDHVTPRYVLERRSNFARALYPVVKHMYDAGLVSINDTYNGEGL